MEKAPNRILVVSESTAPQPTICEPLERLGYVVDRVAVDAVGIAAPEGIHAVVVSPHGLAPEDIEATVARIRDAWGIPVLLAEWDPSFEAAQEVRSLAGVAHIPYRVSDETVEWYIGSSRDLHSLHAQFVRHRDLLQEVPVGVFEIADGRLTYVNDYLLGRTGYTLEQIRSLPLEELFVPEDRPRFAEAMRALPQRDPNEAPHVYRFLSSNGQVFVGEVRSRAAHRGGSLRIEGTIRDITQETRIMQLHRIVLELTEVILAEPQIDKILQLVLDTIVEYSGFRRALLSLYDLSSPNPADAAVYKIMTSGLTPEQNEAIHSQPPMPVEHRRLVYSDRFKLGPAYYIPHDETPWVDDHGITGTVTVEGWHPDDYLFIPLRGAGGIIGSISVDDPIDRSVPTVESIEPVAFLANFAAFTVERVFKLKQMRRQAAQLHGLATLGAELSKLNNERSLCEIAAERVQSSMKYDACGVYLSDGPRLVHEAVACREGFPDADVPQKGARLVADGPGIDRWVLQHGEAAVIPDVTKDPRYQDARETIRSYLAVPIIGRKGVLGVIYAACLRLSAFDYQDLEIFVTVASHLATAISGIRRRAALNRIYAFGQQIAIASTESQAVTSTLDFLIEQFDFQLSTILMLRDPETLVVEGVGGAYSNSRVRKGWTTSTSRGVIGWVAQHKASLLVADVLEDARYFEAFPGTLSELAVPILFDDDVLGVINIESPQLAFFDDDDRRLIEVVANHLAIALSNIASRAGLREQAIRDPLTGLFNRHYFNSIIASELSRSDRYKHPLALMMLDIDGFRAVNNQMGHLMGDDVLQNVARMLERNVRESDRVIRYGGDEFLVFMPETDGSGDSQRIASRLRKDISHVLQGTGAEEMGLRLGLSIGIYSRRPGDTKTMEEILEEVDRRMYADKRKRNADRADDYRH